jgi:hypothetical protein
LYFGKQYYGESHLSKFILLIVFCFIFGTIVAQNNRIFSGTLTTPQFETVPNVSIEVETSGGIISTTSDSEGAFLIRVPIESLSVKFYGKNIDRRREFSLRPKIWKICR